MQSILSSSRSKIWRCQVCGHMEINQDLYCSECSYLRFDDEGDAPWIQAESPRIKKLKPQVASQAPSSVNSTSATSSSTDSDFDEQDLIELAFSHLQRLFERARTEGHTLSTQEQADVYRSLLGSFLKLERQKVRNFLLEQEKENLRQEQMRKLSLVWFLGISFGLVMAYLLGFV